MGSLPLVHEFLSVLTTSTEAPTRPVVTLFFRRPWSNGSYSIEASFNAMLAAFPRSAAMGLQRFVSSYPSKGIRARLLAMLEVRRQASAINHITGDVHFLALALPGCSTVLTVHDCRFLHSSTGLRHYFLRWFWLSLPVNHVRVVTTVSEATRQDVIALSACDPDKEVVVPTTISPAFVPVLRGFPARPWVLHVGVTANKNFARHVEALRGLNCRLRVVGDLDRAQRQLLEDAGVEYETLRSLSADGMRAAYVESDVLLFASTFEGFGMPILEAQATGRPVITSNLSSMTEVAGDAACFVDPTSVADIRAGVQRVLDDPDYRQDLIMRGLRNVERYSPRRVAGMYAEIYAQLLNA